MPTFALDTATPQPSLALLEGDEALAELMLERADGGGRRVLEAAHHLLAAAGLEVGEIDRIVVGLGPGGFTGLRIGIATALALGQALSVPVEGASTLEALALGIADAGAGHPAPILAPATDARRREVFAAAYRVVPGGLEEVLAPAAWHPPDLAGALAGVGAAQGAAVLVAGDGARLPGLDHPGLSVLAPGSPAQRVRAVNLVRRVAQAGPRPVAPAYLRLPDAEENRLRRLTATGATP
ncbi:MAG: tRNA (adenosine(37)-N6)-threonylcarbamoyltransferase complex dimerization subunit type 1 TsaB [Thermoleophilia bacterium]|nr:tRNA (adenosine(37)-N6)-threonylcarbamoyltransferase complex dimerization subunit type 1 TsaB [Thermoleophilia bacterium]